MRFSILLFIIFFVLPVPLQAMDQGLVIRNTNVYPRASGNDQPLGRIPAGAEVSVFSRQGGWKEIFSDQLDLIGWVPSYHVREGYQAPPVVIESATDSRGFLSGLASFSRQISGFFSHRDSATSASTATIGVRGLSEDQIRKASPDLLELEKLKRYASDKNRMRAFADRGGLAARQVDHLEAQK